jgi:protocatechuate 3,4-dioxygenase beta subunit
MLTGADGTYTFAGLAPGTYKVSFGIYAKQIWYHDKPDQAHADPVVVTGGAVTAGIDATYPDETTITGRVTAPDGSGVAGFSVRAWYTDEPGFMPVSNATTAADGSYSMSVGPGTYVVMFVPPWLSPFLAEWYQGQAARDTATPVTVAAGQVASGIDARLRLGGSISGRVVTAGGTPLAGVLVSVFPLPDTSVGLPTVWDYTAADGTYRIGGLTSGTYLVEFTPPSAPYVTQWYRNAISRLDATPVTVTVGADTSGVDATLVNPLATGSLQGTVRGDHRQPLTGIAVRLVGPGGITRTVATAADGTYRFAELTPGTYTITVEPPSTSPYLGTTTTSITVTASQTATLDVQLGRAGAITGRVTGWHGDRLDGVTVKLLDRSTHQVVATTTTNAKGEYTFSRLRPGRYLVAFEPPAGSRYLIQYWDGANVIEHARTVTVTPGRTVRDVDAHLTTRTAPRPRWR